MNPSRKRPFWIRFSSIVFCTSLVCIGCQEDSFSPVIDVFIVGGDGGNPVAGMSVDELQIELSQEEFPTQEVVFPVVDGQFDFGVEFLSLTAMTRLRTAFEGSDIRLLASSPPFRPSETLGFIRLVAVPASSCERVDFSGLEVSRTHFNMVRSGTFAFSAGGTSVDNDSEQVEFLDLLSWESGLFEGVSLSDLGPTYSALIDEDRVLVVPEIALPFIFNLGDANDRIDPVILHAGAGSKSAVISISSVGAMVVGGELDGVSSNRVSLVESDGTVRSRTLSVSRSGPAVVVLGQDVLVVGGDDEGTAEVLFEGASTGVLVDSVSDGIRRDGVFVGDGNDRALWLGGTDASGNVRQDTLMLTGCPFNCVGSEGPDWNTARVGVLNPEQSALLVGGQQSTLIEEVQWTGSNVHIEPISNLIVPRAWFGGIFLPSGALIVSGGQDGVSIRSDLEFCVPLELKPL